LVSNTCPINVYGQRWTPRRSSLHFHAGWWSLQALSSIVSAKSCDAARCAKIPARSPGFSKLREARLARSGAGQLRQRADQCHHHPTLLRPAACSSRPSTDSNTLLAQARILEQKRERNGGERQRGHMPTRRASIPPPTVQPALTVILLKGLVAAAPVGSKPNRSPAVRSPATAAPPVTKTTASGVTTAPKRPRKVSNHCNL
jgi:hypothetical protein